MDMIYDELNRVLDSAGVPRIVAQRCPWCDGKGTVVSRRVGDRGYSSDWGYTLERCTACAGNGKITVEVA